jgi:hypothetical protein
MLLDIDRPGSGSPDEPVVGFRRARGQDYRSGKPGRH